MSNTIKIFPRDSKEHKLLELAAALLTVKSPNQYRYYVGETYFDYGQDWKWTTILCEDGSHGYQALSPKAQELILNEQIEEAVDKWVLGNKYCPDKIREEVK